jgi:ribonuclease HI
MPHFKPTHGLRQGDPLSPYLFILCMEKLSVAIHDAVLQGRWEPIHITNDGPQISHLLFADDVLLFTKAKSSQLHFITSLFDRFSRASGLKINISKSRALYSSGTPNGKINNLTAISGIQSTTSLGKYLGFPMLQGRPRRNDFNFIIEKMQTRLASWKNRLLNRTGRLTLATSVLSSIPTYYMQINWLPQNVCDSIDQTTRNFIWKGSNNKGIHLVNWKTVTRPKHIGGLGVRSARDANTCLLGKLVWDMVQSTNKLWVNLLSNKYSTGPCMLDARVTSSSSPSWSYIVRAKNILKAGYTWRAGAGTSSFWFSNWSSHGLLGSLVPIIDIHDLHLSVKDVFTSDGQHTDVLYTNLPQHIADTINNSHMRFNAHIEDALIWNHNKNGVYTTKSGYSWLLSLSETNSNDTSWSWIWRLKAPEKYKFLIWLACHNATPTLSLLHRRNMTASATCSRCGENEETFLHCVRDCKYSTAIWHKIGFDNTAFFTEGCAQVWLKTFSSGPRASSFLAGLWWSWRHRNMMCISNETWPLFRISFHIQDSVNVIEASFKKINATPLDRMVRWNQNNHLCHILNVDGSCLGSPTRAGFGGIIRNNAGFYLSGFSGFIPDSKDILLAELTALHRGFLLAVAMGIEDLACYSDSLLSINLITGRASNFHAYAVLIQDIKDLLSAHNFSVHHCLREGNQCADFMAKLGASSNEECLVHASPPHELLVLIRNDAIGTSFPRA